MQKGFLQMLRTAERFDPHITTMAVVYNDHCKATTKAFS